MKKYIIIIILGTLFSCNNDFTDIPQEKQLPATQFFKTQQDAIVATNAIYANLRNWKHVWANLAVTSINTDDADKGSSPGDASFFNEFSGFSFSPTSFVFTDYWSGQYEDINFCNQVITNIPPIKMDETLKSRLIAEAKCLRAMAYFNLVRTFGGVPIYDGLPTDGNYNKTRSSVTEVYDFIINNLKTASSILPQNYPSTDIGRTTKGTALAYLAKVYLYQKNWAEAKNISEQVMNLGYSLFPNYNDLFRIQNENSSESIFEIQCTYIANKHSFPDAQFAQCQGVRGQFGWGFNNPSQDLNQSYNPNDLRREATILYRGTTTIEGDLINVNADNPRYNKKMYVPKNSPNFGGDGAGQNVRLMRYAEILLINAEANNELGNSAMALISLNQVRNRAGLSPSLTTDQITLRNEIYNERRWELAMEGDRFFDLVRTGRAETVLNAVGKPFKKGKNEIFPIPENQIILSNGILTQNPGY